jgi:hypothetical protein
VWEGFPSWGCLFAHANLPIPTVSNHLSLHSLRFSSLLVWSAYALLDFLNVSVLEQAAFARMLASSFPLMPLCAGIHATIILCSFYSCKGNPNSLRE